MYTVYIYIYIERERDPASRWVAGRLAALASCATGSFAAPSWHGDAVPDAARAQLSLFMCFCLLSLLLFVLLLTLY